MWTEFDREYEADRITDHYYIISARWLRNWKAYVSYNEVVAQKPPSRFIGGPKPPKINTGIVVQDLKSLGIMLRYHTNYYDFGNK